MSDKGSVFAKCAKEFLGLREQDGYAFVRRTMMGYQIPSACATNLNMSTAALAYRLVAGA
ncbi:hypothetical protein HYALB_00011073 [Hymenoscyphus albidus]|uniref:Uncharacterized protein n=1 Tax=Hymenoscyphus albidus TaxID=595503 RepID=A0A9N9LG87_9HELO|nr:hypothetical protein HYALB_00011073 [Hymenoscyphus albidus]